MKILHLYDGHERVFPGEGSVPYVVYELAHCTAELGHKTVVLERRWTGTTDVEKIDGVDFVRIELDICSNISNGQIVYDQIKSPLGALRIILDRTMFAIKANRFVKQNDFDIVHVHLPFAANVLIWLNPGLRKKMIYTAHVGEERIRFNFGPDDKGPFFFKMISPDLLLMKRIRKNVVLNRELRSKLLGKGIRPECIDFVPNGVTISEYRCDDKEYRVRNGLESKIVVMFAGSITPRKGVDYLVKAAEFLKSKENVMFLIVGNPNVDLAYSKKIHDLIEEHHLNNVKFTGFVSLLELKSLYSACDIFALPSFGEGDSIALKEALASGKPLIGTNIGGISSQIKDGWNGFLIEPANERQLAEKIQYLVDNEAIRKQMGRNSRQFAEEEFDWVRIAKKYLEIYKDML